MKIFVLSVLLTTPVLTAQNAPKPASREEMAKTFRAKALDPVTLKKEAAKAGGCMITRHDTTTEDMRGTTAKSDSLLAGMSITGGGMASGLPGQTGRLTDSAQMTAGKMVTSLAVLDERDRMPRFFEPGERISVTAFRFMTEEGASKSIGDLAGKVTLLFLFRTDCRWTLDMMGEVLRLYGIEDKAGIRVIAVSIVNPGWAPVNGFRKSVGPDLPAAFPIYLPSQDSAFGLEVLGELKTAPTTFILDRQGRIAWRINGAAPGVLADKLNMIRTEL